MTPLIINNPIYFDLIIEGLPSGKTLLDATSIILKFKKPSGSIDQETAIKTLVGCTSEIPSSKVNEIGVWVFNIILNYAGGETITLDARKFNVVPLFFT